MRRAPLCKKGRPCSRNSLSDRTPWRGTATAPSVRSGVGIFPIWPVSTCRWKLCVPPRGIWGINHIRRKTSDKSFSPFHPRPKLIGENCAEGRYSEILSTRFVLSIVRCRERGRQAGADCAVIPPSRNLVLNRWSTVGSVHHRRCHFGPTRLARASLPERPPRLNGGFPTNVVNTPAPLTICHKLYAKRSYN